MASGLCKPGSSPRTWPVFRFTSGAAFAKSDDARGWANSTESGEMSYCLNDGAIWRASTDTLVFEHNRRDRKVPRMRKRQMHSRRADIFEPAERRCVKPNRRHAAIGAHDFNIPEGDATGPSGAQRLHRRFLGGEPGRVTR